MFGAKVFRLKTINMIFTQSVSPELHAATYSMIIKQPGKERERNVLFNDALNTFYLRLYGVRPMVKDHSDNEPHRLLIID